jgi:hypothetical protein
MLGVLVTVVAAPGALYGGSNAWRPRRTTTRARDNPRSMRARCEAGGGGGGTGGASENENERAADTPVVGSEAGAYTRRLFSST